MTLVAYSNVNFTKYKKLSHEKEKEKEIEVD